MVTARGTLQAMTNDGLKQVYTRAENGSRRAVLMIGLGMLSALLGTVLGRWVLMTAIETVPMPESETAAQVLGTLVVCLWAFTLLPVCAWASVRFFEMSAGQFALVAGLSGELFSLLLRSAAVGITNTFETHFEAALEFGAMALALALTWFAGQQAARRLQRLAEAAAQRQAAQAAAAQSFVEGSPK